MLIKKLKVQTEHKVEWLSYGAGLYAWVDTDNKLFYKHIKKARFSKRQIKIQLRNMGVL